MLDSRLLRTDPGAVAANLARRGFVLDTAQFAALEERRKALQLDLDRLRNERNTRSKAIGRAKAQGQDIAPLLAEVESLGDALARTEADFAALQADLDRLLLGLPNLLHASVPEGRDGCRVAELDSSLLVPYSLKEFDPIRRDIKRDRLYVG